MELYLDGACFLERKVLDKQENWESLVAKEGWARLSMPIQVALTCISTVCGQAIRGTTTIFAGVFTLSGKKIVAGLKDYLFLLVQAVTLPVIGIVATFHPNSGLSLLEKLTKFDAQNYYTEKTSSARYVRIVESAFRGVGGVPCSFIQMSSMSVSYLLRGKVKKAAAHMKQACVMPFKSFGGIFAGGWNADLYQSVHEACGIKKTTQICCTTPSESTTTPSEST